MNQEDYRTHLHQFVELKRNIEHMEETEGWKCVIEWILQFTKNLQEKMLDCKLEEIDLIRGQIKSLIILLNYISECKLKGDVALKELEKKGEKNG